MDPTQTRPEPGFAVEIDRVSVRYGRTSVLDQISLSIARGTTYALLGRNGAGKSSLIRCLIGQRPAAAGRLSLLSLDPWNDRVQVMQRVGYLPEVPNAPPRWTVGQLVSFSRRLYRDWSDEETEARLDRFSISTSTRFGQLSRGQKTQVGLALALGSRPELLLLDDPTLGLDAVARKELFDVLIAEMADRAPAVLLASHDFRGIERLASRVGILHRGELILEGDIDRVKRRFKRLMFARASDGELLKADLEKLAPLSVDVNSWGTEAVVEIGSASVEEMLSGTPAGTLTLEEIFVAMTERKEEPCAS